MTNLDPEGWIRNLDEVEELLSDFPATLPSDRWVRRIMPALVAELRIAREFRHAIWVALQPGRWRGFDGPDGVSQDEVIEDVANALVAHDQATASGKYCVVCGWHIAGHIPASEIPGRGMAHPNCVSGAKS